MSRCEQRAALILQVRSGQLTAEAAARQLGISRQRYYQWEQRALKALLTALEDQPKGRPKGETDPEKEALQARVQQLEDQVQLFQERERLRQMIMEAGKKTPKNDPGLPPRTGTNAESHRLLPARALRRAAVLQCDALVSAAAPRRRTAAKTRPKEKQAAGLKRGP